MKMSSIVLTWFISLIVFSCSDPYKQIHLPPCKTPSDTCVSQVVHGYIFPMKQEYDYSCWATVLTMLFSWKEQKPQNTKKLVGLFGPEFLAIYSNSKSSGIDVDEEVALYDKAGLQIERQLDPSIEGWADYIKDYGPLSITIDANPPYGGTVHALLIVGISGSTNGQNTTIAYIDTANGKIHYVPFMRFLKMYEAKYAVDWPVQIIHFPKK